jgi:hypothetical protein
MPKNPMKNRVVRVSDRIWDAAKARADANGESISDAVRRSLERYAKPVIEVSITAPSGLTCSSCGHVVVPETKPLPDWYRTDTPHHMHPHTAEDAHCMPDVR